MEERTRNTPIEIGGIERRKDKNQRDYRIITSRTGQRYQLWLDQIPMVVGNAYDIDIEMPPEGSKFYPTITACRPTLSTPREFHPKDTRPEPSLSGKQTCLNNAGSLVAALLSSGVKSYTEEEIPKAVVKIARALEGYLFGEEIQQEIKDAFDKAIKNEEVPAEKKEEKKASKAQLDYLETLKTKVDPEIYFENLKHYEVLSLADLTIKQASELIALLQECK